MAAAGAAFLAPSKSARAAAFPVHYARPNPFDAVLKYVEPGSDEFQGEKAAFELEARLGRIFAGLEEAPEALKKWTNVQAARFFALPDSRVRFEIKLDGRYEIGIWKLPDFAVLEHEAVSSEKPWFRDVTSHVFGRTESFQQQLLPGNVWWRARLDSAAGIDVYGNQGIAAGDIDNDGVDEIYVCQPGGLPDRIYKFTPDGSAEDITERAGLGILDETTSALFVDFRNSGNQDLVVLRGSGPLLFLNQGNGVFKELPNAFRFKTTPQGSFTGMAAADYDRDGRVDLYLCCYVYFQSEDQYQYPAPYHDAQNGPPNYLFRNALTGEGGAFEDVTEASGIDENNNRFSFAPAWCDTRGDGWPDLYVANDFGRNNFYRNHEGHFKDDAAKAGIEDIGPGMSASWFDYDGDGRPDLYVSNMWTAPGQRITADPAFQPAVGNREAYRRHSKGNSLYRNQGDGRFEETSPREHVEMGRWAWGSGGFDFDLDGRPEIFITSGMTTNESRKDLSSFFWRQVVARSPAAKGASAAYENGWNALNQLIREDYSWEGHAPNVFYIRRDGRYRDASGVSGLDFADDSRAFAVTDFDGDGYPDLVLKSRRGPQIRALQNNCATGRPAVAIRLRGTKSNRDGIGARVEVNGQTQFLQAGSGFLSQHSKKLHFGLAGGSTARVRISWPSGAQQDFPGLAPGHVYTVTEGGSQPAGTAFSRLAPFPAGAPEGENSPARMDTWLIEPVPTPDQRRGPGFLLLYSGTQPSVPSTISIELVNLDRVKDGTAEAYSLFRRYLFEYRTELALPLTLLIDNEGRARRVYATVPSEATMRADLNQMDSSRAFALPFRGRYYLEPHRNYFKLGAAFYWAGYPGHALPYLQETLRSRPDNWKALLAMGRIDQELNRPRDALATFQQVLSIKPTYAPALVSAGEAHLALRDKESARRLFEKALEVDTNCADAANQLGIMAAESNDTKGARQWFERAIAAQRDHPGAINNLAVLYAKTGQPKDSVAAFRYGIQMVPDDEELYLNLARIYVTMGERDQARTVLTQLLERKPGNLVAGKALAQLEGQ